MELPKMFNLNDISKLKIFFGVLYAFFQEVVVLHFLIIIFCYKGPVFTSYDIEVVPVFFRIPIIVLGEVLVVQEAGLVDTVIQQRNASLDHRTRVYTLYFAPFGGHVNRRRQKYPVFHFGILEPS